MSQTTKKEKKGAEGGRSSIPKLSRSKTREAANRHLKVNNGVVLGGGKTQGETYRRQYQWHTLPKRSDFDGRKVLQ